jgi:hypothetical protein
MRSKLASLLAMFSGYCSKHDFVEIDRKRHKWFEEAVVRSPIMDLRIVVARGDEVSVEARPSNSDEDWYGMQTILEMVTVGGITKAPRFLDLQNTSLLIDEMELAQDGLIAFFSQSRSDREKKYSLWVEGSYWGDVLKGRAARQTSSGSKPWWKLW